MLKDKKFKELEKKYDKLLDENIKLQNAIGDLNLLNLTKDEIIEKLKKDIKGLQDDLKNYSELKVKYINQAKEYLDVKIKLIDYEIEEEIFNIKKGTYKHLKK